MQIVFMGTPDFAVGALEALIAQGHEITAVVTQPDKAKGRSGQLQFPPVKECAVKHGIPVFQPRRIKTPEAIEELKKYPADVYIVAAFGQILSQEILDLPKYGCLNIHASLLPKYRGASPIQRVIIDGETVVNARSGFSDLQPRACLGQSKYGEIIALLVEGRLTTSVGISVPDCAAIMTKHDCMQAMNLDGGTSAMIWYKGKYIMRSSNPALTAGRTLPNAFVYTGN